MSEAHAFIALHSFLTGFAQSQYEAGIDVSLLEEGGISRWPEAVQYLLRSYAQSTYISSAISDLRNNQQRPGVNEQLYSKRTNDEVSHCRKI